MALRGGWFKKSSSEKSQENGSDDSSPATTISSQQASKPTKNATKTDDSGFGSGRLGKDEDGEDVIPWFQKTKTERALTDRARASEKGEPESSNLANKPSTNTSTSSSKTSGARSRVPIGTAFGSARDSEGADTYRLSVATAAEEDFAFGFPHADSITTDGDGDVSINPDEFKDFSCADLNKVLAAAVDQEMKGIDENGTDVPSPAHGGEDARKPNAAKVLGVVPSHIPKLNIAKHPTKAQGATSPTVTEKSPGLRLSKGKVIAASDEKPPGMGRPRNKASDGSPISPTMNRSGGKASEDDTGESDSIIKSPAGKRFSIPLRNPFALGQAKSPSGAATPSAMEGGASAAGISNSDTESVTLPTSDGIVQRQQQHSESKDSEKGRSRTISVSSAGSRDMEVVFDEDDGLVVALPEPPPEELHQLISTLQSKFDKSIMRLDLSKDDITQFLRARNWKLKPALNLIKNYAKWYLKHELAPIDLTIDRVRAMLLQGIIMAPGGMHTKLGQRVMYMRPFLYFPKLMDLRLLMEASVYIYERMVEDPEVRKDGFTFLANMKGWTWDNFTVRYATQWFMLMQFIMPANISNWYMVDAPSWFDKVWVLIRPGMTSSFADKWKFFKAVEDSNAPHILEAIEQEHLPVEMGGNYDIDMQYYCEYRRRVEDDEIGFKHRVIYKNPRDFLALISDFVPEPPSMYSSEDPKEIKKNKNKTKEDMEKEK